ncbi:DUF2304 domain-containing protein [Desulfoferrobacter suflitae]|uniref:DUF2304 domain-containing protein n=1 Tax=Desulfoferrobacter suflitae TaxID=2865782 RepID=UPI0021649E29|nr:DUF2304 family protein [Desulfoferrobacter suflitae]MCK8602171.1 DUF2304 family protein [Desulfoferrobacter suflitae]
MVLEIIIMLFGAFAVSRSYLRYRERLLTLPIAIFWVGLWIVIVGAVFFKNWTSSISLFFGIGRGADFFLFGAILLLSYLCFRLYVKLEETRQDLTNLVRAISINEKRALLDQAGSNISEKQLG